MRNESLYFPLGTTEYAQTNIFLDHQRLFTEEPFVQVEGLKYTKSKCIDCKFKQNIFSCKFKIYFIWIKHEKISKMGFTMDALTE